MREETKKVRARALILEKKEEKTNQIGYFLEKLCSLFLNSGYERENYYRHVTVAQPRDYE